MPTLEYWFDFSCPYAYLGATQIEAIAARHDVAVDWRPMLLGGVFRAVNTPDNLMAALPPAKARHNALDMLRWADYFGVPLSVPARHPMRTVRALRALLALPADLWPPAIHAVYRAYWVKGEDVSDRHVVAEAFGEAGVAGEALDRALAANDDDAIKAELRRRTDEAIARGIFGAPAMFVDGLMFWGQDRLHMVDAALGGWRPEGMSGGA